jgi:hypothetical protein
MNRLWNQLWNRLWNQLWNRLWNQLWNRLCLDIFLCLWVRWKSFWRAQQAVIISGFPAVGKTSLAINAAGEPLPNGYLVVDLDSSCYSQLASGERNPSFPRNYMEAISERIFDKEILLVSTHESVRKHLASFGLWFMLVYPLRESKLNTLDLLEGRGDHYLALVVNREFNNFIGSLEGQGSCEHRQLREGEFLAHVVDDAVQCFVTRK